MYMIVDIWDRFIVGYRVYECESAENASKLIIDTCAGQGRPLVLHSDNGSPMKGATMLATLYELGIRPSRSRPRVSNDNPYSESLFKTVKYRPNFQPNGFESLRQAREWVDAFVAWYNNEHHHSGLKYLTPEQRRSGKGDIILAARHAVYEAAKAAHPERWKNRETRDWTLEKAVYLNPAKASIESLLTGKQPQST